jgi:hypothetical protein
MARTACSATAHEASRQRPIKATLPNIVTFNAAFAASHTADSIVKVLTHGKSTDMPSFKGKLTPQQMMTVAKYVLALASK